MPPETLRLVLSFGILMVLVLLALEIQGWMTGKRLVNRKQKVFRITSAALIVAILAMILVGDGPARAFHPLMAIGYWALCFSLACVVVVLALADMKQVALRFGEERRHNYDDLAGREDRETR